MVWDVPAKNPFFTTMFGALRSVVPMPDPPAGAPGPFALAAPSALEGAFTAAGFTSVETESVPFVFDFDSVDHHFEVNVALAAPLKRAAESLPAEGVARLRVALADALAPYRDGERIRITATALCASAAR